LPTAVHSNGLPSEGIRRPSTVGHWRAADAVQGPRMGRSRRPRRQRQTVHTGNVRSFGSVLAGFDFRPLAKGNNHMSIQFGRWNTDGKPVETEYLENVKPVIAPYGLDDSGSYSKTSISIL